MSDFDLNFPRVLGEPLMRGELRTTPEDFIVDEIPAWVATGEGEHFLLHIRKRGANTGWVAEQLAKLANIKLVDVGFCGLKDRHAVTTQWFSLYLAKRDVEWQSWDIEGVEILSAARHSQKLRRGMHAANRFELTLNKVEGDWDDLEQRLQALKLHGVPNYFGEQRFGHEGQNLLQALQMFAQHERDALARQNSSKRQKPKRKSKKQGLYLSAARSWLYNQILADRIQTGTWNQCLSGEAVPQASLWGRGRAQLSDDAEAAQQDALQRCQLFLDGLEHSGLNQELRDLVLRTEQLSWSLNPGAGNFKLSFLLPVGTFATAVLRELLWYDVPSQRHNKEQ